MIDAIAQDPGFLDADALEADFDQALLSRTGAEEQMMDFARAKLG